MKENTATVLLQGRADLGSWKEIADYFGIHVRTAQVWEAQLGMPVRRQPGVRGRVYASAQELNEWNLQRKSLPALRYPRGL